VSWSRWNGSCAGTVLCVPVLPISDNGGTFGTIVEITENDCLDSCRGHHSEHVMRERRCVLFDWGDTLMVDYPEYDGPMVEWPEIVVGARLLNYIRCRRR